jgi:hypothetical protein
MYSELVRLYNMPTKNESPMLFSFENEKKNPESIRSKICKLAKRKKLNYKRKPHKKAASITY